MLALALISAPALAYNEAVHAFITARAIHDPRLLTPPTQEDLDAFRILFWQRAIEHPEFAHRYPSVEAFTAWEFKQFLMLDPSARVHGFDLTPEDAAPMQRGRLLSLASRWPDDDRRNQDRYLRDERTHEVVKAKDGSPMPYDPATLDFGALSGTTSQGHAHYGLVEGPLSDDPAVLKSEPWRFAVPPTAHAYGPEFVHIYTDLSALAAGSGLPSAAWLSATFAGAAFHHLEDLCNQIHTVQVGTYQFFREAFIQSKLRDLETLGGLLGQRRSLRQIGVRLIANHHLLSEDYFAKHLGEMDIREIDEPDAAIAAAPDLARAIIEKSSREALRGVSAGVALQREDPARRRLRPRVRRGARRRSRRVHLPWPRRAGSDRGVQRRRAAGNPPGGHRGARLGTALSRPGARSGAHAGGVPLRGGPPPRLLRAFRPAADGHRLGICGRRGGVARRGGRAGAKKDDAASDYRWLMMGQLTMKPLAANGRPSGAVTRPWLASPMTSP